MLSRHIPIHFNVPGTLVADTFRRVQFPFPVQLVGVTATCDSSTSFILDVGIELDPDSALDGVTVTGNDATQTSFGRTDFVGDEYPTFAANTSIRTTVDYDGGAGGDAANVNITLIFTEG